MYNNEIYDWYSDFDDFDESLNDIDFSEVAGKKGDFKKSFKNANNKIEQKKVQKKVSRTQPVSKRPIIRRPVENRTSQKPVQRQPGKVVAPKAKQQGLPKRKELVKPKPKQPQPQPFMLRHSKHRSQSPNFQFSENKTSLMDYLKITKFLSVC